MQTPISFILDLILDYELPPDAQKACRKYVRELEKSITPVPTVRPIRPVGIQQAPSTQRLMEQQETNPIVGPPVVTAANRIVGGEVNTGHGSKGPRKW